MQDWVGLPAGVKFDPTDQELMEHLDAKVEAKELKSHPLIDEFIPTIEGDDGICYTHPEKLPGEYYIMICIYVCVCVLLCIVVYMYHLLLIMHIHETLSCFNHIHKLGFTYVHLSLSKVCIDKNCME